VDVKNAQAVPTVCNHGPLKAHRGSRVLFSKGVCRLDRLSVSRFSRFGIFPVLDYLMGLDISEDTPDSTKAAIAWRVGKI